MKPRRLRMSWRDKKNTIDCGVFVMRHMETYVGQSMAALDCGIRRGDARCLRELRVRFLSDLLLFHSNTHHLSNATSIDEFAANVG
nr:uncharacterized protein LOC109168900 [Ipomoea trifida]GLL46304.1 uncharacterized protein LOC109168900 [Ipomoea trifida]